MNKKRSPWANIIGGGLAHLQDGLDKLTAWGFKKMRQAGEAEEKVPAESAKKEENKYFKMAKKAGKTALSFLGSVGDAFYDEYGRLKGKSGSKGEK